MNPTQNASVVLIQRIALTLSRQMYPEDFQAVFMGGVLASIVGNLPDDYWKRMQNRAPCGVPNCDCHLLAPEIFNQLNLLREDFKKYNPVVAPKRN